MKKSPASRRKRVRRTAKPTAAQQEVQDASEDKLCAAIAKLGNGLPAEQAAAFQSIVTETIGQFRKQAATYGRVMTSTKGLLAALFISWVGVRLTVSALGDVFLSLMPHPKSQETTPDDHVEQEHDSSEENEEQEV